MRKAVQTIDVRFRLTPNDVARLDEQCTRFEMPRAELLRYYIRQGYDSMGETIKTDPLQCPAAHTPRRRRYPRSHERKTDDEERTHPRNKTAYCVAYPLGGYPQQRTQLSSDGHKGTSCHPGDAGRPRRRFRNPSRKNRRIADPRASPSGAARTQRAYRLRLVHQALAATCSRRAPRRHRIAAAARAPHAGTIAHTRLYGCTCRHVGGIAHTGMAHGTAAAYGQLHTQRRVHTA
jgi:hypothetical protein